MTFEVKLHLIENMRIRNVSILLKFQYDHILKRKKNSKKNLSVSRKMTLYVIFNGL